MVLRDISIKRIGTGVNSAVGILSARARFASGGAGGS